MTRPETRRGGPVAACAAALLLALSPAARALTPAELFAQVSPSIWRVQTFDRDGLPLGQGSGVVTGFGELVTNCHVLARARRVQVRRDGGAPPLPARLARWDVQRDLCQLSVAGLAAPAVTLGRADQAAVGQTAYTVGHPKGLDLTMAAGLVSSIRRNEAGQLVLLQTSAAISGGSSGGALFNERGELLGITTLGIFGGDSQNLNFAIPAEWILDLPRRHAAARAAAAPASQPPPPASR